MGVLAAGGLNGKTSWVEWLARASLTLGASLAVGVGLVDIWVAVGVFRLAQAQEVMGGIYEPPISNYLLSVCLGLAIALIMSAGSLAALGVIRKDGSKWIYPLLLSVCCALMVLVGPLASFWRWDSRMGGGMEIAIPGSYLISGSVRIAAGGIVLWTSWALRSRLSGRPGRSSPGLPQNGT